jgi:uncharacterized membrane protein
MPNIHPFLTHFPIALLSLSIVCECAAVILNREEFSTVGWWTQLAGTIGLAAAVVTGTMAAQSVGISPAGKPYFDMHREIAFLASTVFAILLFWRIAARTKRPPGHDILFLVIFGGGVLALWAGAWYGGEMVYRFGAGVQAPPFP